MAGDSSRDSSRDSSTAESTEFDSRNARIGLVFFFAYVLLYATFVYLSAFRADVMAMKPIAGINVAIWYGLGLIVAAIVLAVLYMFACKTSRNTGVPPVRGTFGAGHGRDAHGTEGGR